MGLTPCLTLNCCISSSDYLSKESLSLAKHVLLVPCSLLLQTNLAVTPPPMFCSCTLVLPLLLRSPVCCIVVIDYQGDVIITAKHFLP